MKVTRHNAGHLEWQLVMATVRSLSGYVILTCIYDEKSTGRCVRPTLAY